MNSSFILARSLPHTLKAFLQFSRIRNFSTSLSSEIKIPTVKQAVSKYFVPQQIRKIQTLDFCGVKEKVYESSDWPKEKYQKFFKNDTIAMIGYGSQGNGQSLNARDNGLNVIVGVREGGNSWNKALKDGWQPGKDLFSINDALERGTVINNLLSDAAQKELWPQFIKHLTKGKTLCFCHGFSIVYKEYTNVIPPTDIDVIMIAPKGSGKTLRSLFLDGRGMNSSVAIFQDISGDAIDKAVAFGVAIGSAFLYETTFLREVFADLVGERGVLLGAIQGLFLAQYEVLRARGHPPSEAFNETVEEATQSLYPLIGQNGMDWMYDACSTTARRGALDWYKHFYEANKPVFEKLYSSVADGSETRRVLEKNSSPTYAEDLEEELKEIRESEIWRTGRVVRKLRPEKKSN